MPSLPTPGRRTRVSLLVLGWLALALVLAGFFFLGSSRATTIASHDAELSPSLDGHVVLLTGPVLPDVRMEVAGPLGVEVALGKTDVDSPEELFQRYAAIAANSEAQVTKVKGLLVDMAQAAALRGAALAAVPVVLYLILGPQRRSDLWHGLRRLHPRPWLGAALVVAVVLAFWQPWFDEDDEVQQTRSWEPLGDFLGDSVPLPAEAAALEVRVGGAAGNTRRLIGSAVDSYEKGREFYSAAAEAAADLELHEPAEDETVVLFVTDRHDNVGMDPVARAIGDRAGATAVFGGGDDTSTGSAWEAFSLDSMQASFSDLDRWAVAGNHDHGDFVSDYLDGLGWTMLDGEVVDGPAGGTLLGVSDPRSSGLGSWRDEVGLTFGEVRERLAETACEADERINTILVHDVNLARDALEQGCVDLAVGGHTHVQNGPIRYDGPDGEVGYAWTNGTTGGAAYAIAVGTKPRRDAEVTLITYDSEGVPVGLQWVRLRTDGRYVVGDFEQLDLGPEQVEAAGPINRPGQSRPSARPRS